jgi:uncharacterized membrane protein YGL010W
MPLDAQRPIHRLISTYAESHRNPTNEVIHFVCVPVIVFSFLGLIWALHPLAAVVVMLVSLGYYFRLSVSFGVGHKIEGKKPSFLDDLRFLLIGPLFVLSFLYRRLRISY